MPMAKLLWTIDQGLWNIDNFLCFGQDAAGRPGSDLVPAFLQVEKQQKRKRAKAHKIICLDLRLNHHGVSFAFAADDVRER